MQSAFASVFWHSRTCSHLVYIQTALWSKQSFRVSTVECLSLTVCNDVWAECDVHALQNAGKRKADLRGGPTSTIL